MIVSALLTSVGINLGISVLFFALYSVLRKQPSNIKIYAPRLVAEGRGQARGRFSIETLLPSAGWVRKAWQPTEEDLYNSCGLDGVVFNRIFVFRFHFFSLISPHIASKSYFGTDHFDQPFKGSVFGLVGFVLIMDFNFFQLEGFFSCCDHRSICSPSR